MDHSPHDESQLSSVENKFVNLCSKHCLHQINNTVNSDGKALDLILTTQLMNNTIEVPDTIDLLDTNSRHYSAVVLAITYLANAISSNVVTTINRLNNQKASDQLNLISFNLFDDAELQLDFDEEPAYFIDKINEMTTTIKTVIAQNTNTIKVRSETQTSKHPWTSDKEYKRQQRYQKLAKARFNKCPNDFYRALLRIQNINLYAKYNSLKKAYFEKMVSDVQIKDMRQFYKIMQHKRKSKSALPITMVYNGQHLSGQSTHHFL